MIPVPTPYQLATSTIKSILQRVTLPPGRVKSSGKSDKSECHSYSTEYKLSCSQFVFSECFPAKQIATRNRMIPAMIAMAYPAVVRPPSFVTIKLNIK